jgi:hypothetical protein
MRQSSSSHVIFSKTRNTVNARNIYLLTIHSLTNFPCSIFPLISPNILCLPFVFNNVFVHFRAHKSTGTYHKCGTEMKDTKITYDSEICCLLRWNWISSQIWHNHCECPSWDVVLVHRLLTSISDEPAASMVRKIFWKRITLISTVETTLCHDTVCSNFTYRFQLQMVQSIRNFPHPHNAVQQPACTISHLLLGYGYHQNACRMYHCK